MKGTIRKTGLSDAQRRAGVTVEVLVATVRSFKSGEDHAGPLRVGLTGLSQLALKATTRRFHWILVMALVS